MPTLTVLEVIRKTAEYFGARGMESPRLNAELLVGHALGLPRMQVYLAFERILLEAELSRIRELVRRRGRREPLQHLIGETEFHGLRLKVDGRALVPRPETELLVEIIIARCAPAPARILDLGTGGGAIALALAQALPSAQVTAVDASAAALALAAENAASTGLGARVRLVASDWFSGLGADETFELIVANPPYLSAEEVAAAAPEVRDFEPAGALASGEGGLADLRAILTEAPRRLTPGSWLALETGVEHHPALAELARSAGYARSESLRDLTGRNRFFLAWK
jgi:release factor glutamine methyltransferase